DTGGDLSLYFADASGKFLGKSNYVINWAIGYVNYSKKFAEVVDGLSNTFLISERAMTSPKVSPFYPGANWGAVGHSFNSFAFNDYFNINTPLPPADLKTIAGVPTCCKSVFNPGATNPSSLHVGGAHVVLCDGSVRFLSQNMQGPSSGDPNVYSNLFWPDEGNPVGDY